MSTDKQLSAQTGRVESFVAIVSLLGIACYLTLHYGLHLGAESYSLTLNAALDSETGKVFTGGFVYRTTPAQLPLLAVLLLGGLPLIYGLTVKLLHGDLGADLLAGISIVTAVLLDEYLAGALIVLMLSGGAVLESYAVRRASSVLEALASRMPSVAHRKMADSIADITTEEVLIGDTLLILPHEICPVDGTVTEGSGTMDESYLTG